MATVDVRKLMQTPLGDIEAPKPLPDGFYYGVIGAYEFGTNTNTQNSYFRFPFRLEGPVEDQGFEEDPIVKKTDWTRKEVKRDYYVTPDAMIYLKRLIVGVLGDDLTKTPDERLDELKGRRVMLEIKSSQSKNDPEVFFTNVGNVVKAE